MTRVLYAGLDGSLEITSICVVDAAGGMILEAKAVSDPADIGEVLAGIEGLIERVGFEAGPLSQWLCNGLTCAGLPAVCIEARHAKAAMVDMNRNKRSRNDACSLVQFTRSGWFKAVLVNSSRGARTSNSVCPYCFAVAPRCRRKSPSFAGHLCVSQRITNSVADS